MDVSEDVECDGYWVWINGGESIEAVGNGCGSMDVVRSM